ncbi:MAG TPA: hypothetical protein VII09_04975 [Opitutaceae bacterium]
MDDEKPDTRHLVLKPKEIELTDALSRPGDGTALSVQLIHQQNRLAEEKALRRKRPTLGEADAKPAVARALPPVFKPKVLNPLDPPVRPGDEEAITVPDILLENRIAEDRSGWGRLKRRKRRKSRRNRDFVLLVGGLDLTIAILMKVMASAVTMVYGLSAIALITSTFAWIMFVVNDDY